MTSSHSTPSTTAFRRRTKRRVLAVGAVAALAIAGACFYHSVSSSADAERDARDFVLLNGHTNEGYHHTRFSLILARFLPDSAWNPIRPKDVGVVIPRDRMTDNMARHLLNIRSLDTITLYQAAPDWTGPDANATAITAVQSLRDLELPLAEANVRMLESKFPNLRIWVRYVPSGVSESASESDAIVP